MGSRGRLRVVLHGEEGPHFVSQSLDRVVVQVDMRDLHGLARRAQTLRVHGISVVLRTDRHLSRREIHARLIGTVMAEFQFMRRSPERQTQDLMSETDPEYGLRLDEFSNDRLDTLNGRGIARPVRKEDPIGIECQGLGGRRRRGHDRHVEALFHQKSQDVSLHTEVIGHDFEPTCGTLGTRKLSSNPRPGAVLIHIRRVTGHLGDPVDAIEPGRRSRALDEFHLVL